MKRPSDESQVTGTSPKKTKLSDSKSTSLDVKGLQSDVQRRIQEAKRKKAEREAAERAEKVCFSLQGEVDSIELLLNNEYKR